MLNETEEMICFAAVCDTGSMTAAAKVLNRSKAHVSRKITDLERRIGTSLLHRTTRKITVTDAGTRLKNGALQLYRNSLFLSHQASSLSGELSGSFKITAPTSIFRYVLTPIIAELQEMFPEVAFEFIPSNKTIDLITEGIDLAIRTGSVVDDRLIAHQVGVGRDVLFASTNKYGNGDQFKEIADIVSERIIINPYSYDDERLRLTNGDQNIELKTNRLTKAYEYPLLVDLAKNGCGIGFAPDYAIYEMTKKHEVTPILPEWYGKEWPVFVVYPFIAPVPNKLQKISAYLRKILSTSITFS